METTQKVTYDGLRNVTVRLTGLGDGAGQETNVVKVDVSELNPPGGRVKLEEITYDVAYGVVKLSWANDPAPVDFLLLDGADRMVFRREGGLNNETDPESGNGDILLSTIGFEQNSSYSLILKMVKKG